MSSLANESDRDVAKPAVDVVRIAPGGMPRSPLSPTIAASSIADAAGVSRPKSEKNDSPTGHCKMSASGCYTISEPIKLRETDGDSEDDSEISDCDSIAASDESSTKRRNAWNPYYDVAPTGMTIDLTVTPKITPEMLKVLIGYPIIIEGGIGQGKTSLAYAIATMLVHYGITSSCRAEPTDEVALAEFMKYQLPLPETATADAKREFAENAAKAAINMQFSMMRRRCKQMAAAAIDAHRGGIPVIDRGPFGDDVFMAVTFGKYHVSREVEVAYIAEFQRRYMSIRFPKRNVLIVRVRAPTEVAYQRYLEREKATTGNRYPIEYLQNLETLHDSCSRAWTKHVVYDNSKVTYIPGDKSKKISGHPEESALKSLLAALCKCASELDEERKLEMWSMGD